MSPERYSIIEIILALIALSALFWVGADLRSIAPEHAIPQSNVDSYYFDKTNRLLQDGEFPQQDIWDFAPYTHPENAPPGLAYITAFFYTLITFFSSIDIYEFAHLFSMIIFGIWLAGIFFVFLHLYDLGTALSISAVFTFLPVSVAFTTRGRYFEELIGVPLMFAGVYMLMRVARADHASFQKWITLTTATISLLALSWQQFPVFFVGAVLSLIFIAGSSIKELKSLLIRWGIPLIGGLIVAELISRVFVGISYSVFGMIGEFFYAFVMRSDPDLVLAMSRGDWANLSLQRFFNYFSWPGVVFGILGAAAIIVRWRMREKKIICGFAITGIIMAFMFIKDRYLALAFLLFLFGEGINLLFFPQALAMRSLEMLSQARTWILTAHARITQYKIRIVFLIFGSLSVLLLINVANGYRNPPIPILSLVKDGEWQIGISKTVHIEMRNDGGGPFGGSVAFSGMHVEVINGFVNNIRSSASSTRSSVVFKNFSQTGNAFFFEVKFDTISAKRPQSVSFVVTPYAEPARILYRGWLPGRCGFSQRLMALGDLRKSWKSFKNGWRNEECIRRAPITDDGVESLCRIPVFAAHEKLQNFRCFLAL
ncbi:MAG: hypothetical protein U1A25_01485 [Candidatus Sungbacteria bacterium]|nr:hypothetical protein [bacterium]MDZ4260313.1 hypothetical protein [Candidatus Sungbacteria bacterium]